MTNYEEIKQGLADYEAKVAKANAKFPERKEFKEKHVYTPLDVMGFSRPGASQNQLEHGGRLLF